MKYLFERCFKSDLYLAKKTAGEAMRFLHNSVPEIRDDEAADLRLVFDELLTNAVIHGNRYDSSKVVNLHIEVEDGYVFSKVADEGKGFDYRALVRNFSGDGELLNEHGRGVKLAYYMTDMLYFDANGSEIKFCKRLIGNE